jgi:hypothetical protein
MRKFERYGSRETRKSLIQRERKKKLEGGKLRPIIKNLSDAQQLYNIDQLKYAVDHSVLAQ